jgi:hypothetical protein
MNMNASGTSGRLVPDYAFDAPAPAFYRGILRPRRSGSKAPAERWRCEHEHITGEEAYQCAREEYDRRPAGT